jgi:hypothetical protein
MTVQDAIQRQETIDFLQIAETYCEFVEKENRKGFEYLLNAREVLVTLYAAAIKLPDVPTTTHNEFGGRVTDEEQKLIVKRLNVNIGDKGFYWDTFDPTNEKDTEAVCEDLVDDIADIYRDVKSCLTIYNLGQIEAREHGLWELKFSFDKHWGAHNINALRALHYLIENNQ